MIKVNKQTIKKSSLREKHILWDCGKSSNDDKLLTYYISICGERKDRINFYNKIIEHLDSYGGGIIDPVERKGKNVGTPYRYRFVTFDSRVNSDCIRWDTFNITKIRDDNLYERIKKGCSIDRYIEDLYTK